MTLGYDQILTLALASLAAITAVVNLIRNRGYFKKNIQNEKIEKIYSIIEDLTPVYCGLHVVYQQFEFYNGDEDYHEQLRGASLTAYGKCFEDFSSKYKIDDIRLTLTQLEVLSRSYLSPKECLKVMAFKTLLMDILNCTIKMQWDVKCSFWDEGFPRPKKIEHYTDELANLLIEKIDFSRGEKSFKEKLRKYIEGTFKPALKEEIK